jgi:hypothetical protein
MEFRSYCRGSKLILGQNRMKKTLRPAIKQSVTKILLKPR